MLLDRRSVRLADRHMLAVLVIFIRSHLCPSLLLLLRSTTFSNISFVSHNHNHNHMTSLAAYKYGPIRSKSASVHLQVGCSKNVFSKSIFQCGKGWLCMNGKYIIVHKVLASLTCMKNIDTKNVFTFLFLSRFLRF